MDWKIKAMGQQVLSRLPGGDQLYYFLQKKLGGYRNFRVESKVLQGLRILEALKEIDVSLENKTTCEIGTGWTPILPMVFYVFGQKSCATFDVQRLLKIPLTEEAARQISLLVDLLKEKSPWVWRAAFAERLDVLGRNSHDVAQLFREINLTYLAPVATPYAGIEANSVDLVFSNTTLEHVPSGEINQLFLGAKRVLAPGGIVAHVIDCSDHFSHTDPSISRINFLQFSDAKWQRYNSGFLYQNRLRASTYRAMIEKAGFEIILWKPHIDQKLKAKMHNFLLDKEFLSFGVDDLCTTSVVVVARCKSDFS